MMLESDLEQRVIWLVATGAGLDRRTIGLSSRLLHDLGIDGDDAYELLTEFSEVFQVDRAGFDFYRHFRIEPNIVTIWFGDNSRLVPVTIGELVRSARSGRWTPDPQSPA